MYAKLASGLFAVLFLAACSTMTAEERMARDRATCSGYGFTQGSDAFANCMMALDLDRSATRRARMQSAPPLFARTTVVIDRTSD